MIGIFSSVARFAHPDPDFSRSVLEGMYRYRLKRLWVAFALWLATGVFGGHRIYLERTPTALTMFFTLGGVGIWWLTDLFLLGRMVREYNDDQDARREDGRPPRALAFMPELTELDSLAEPPDWARTRSRGWRLVGDVAVLAIAGSLIGGTTMSGNLEPLVVAVALIGIILAGARWEALAHLPVLRALDRWNHRLRLFYYFNDPGGPLALALRPFILVFGLLRRRRRAEAKLYLQLGVMFAIVFAMIDLGGLVLQGVSPLRIPIAMLGEIASDLVSVFATATPLGAILNTHVILRRKDALVWGLSVVAILAIALGMAAA